jgi:hypothetical protein
MDKDILLERFSMYDLVRGCQEKVVYVLDDLGRDVVREKQVLQLQVTFEHEDIVPTDCTSRV